MIILYYFYCYNLSAPLVSSLLFYCILQSMHYKFKIIIGAAIVCYIGICIYNYNYSYIDNSNSINDNNNNNSFNNRCHSALLEYKLALQRCSNNDFTIHGLFLNPSDACQYCSSEKYNVYNLGSVLRSNMESYWKSCKRGYDSTSFWEHEWNKHGSCSGLTMNQYFDTTMQLYKRYKHTCNTKYKSCNICFDKEFRIKACSSRKW